MNCIGITQPPRFIYRDGSNYINRETLSSKMDNSLPYVNLSWIYTLLHYNIKIRPQIFFISYVPNKICSWKIVCQYDAGNIDLYLKRSMFLTFSRNDFIQNAFNIVWWFKQRTYWSAMGPNFNQCCNLAVWFIQTFYQGIVI